MPPALVVRKHRSQDRWYVVLNNLIDSDSVEYLSCVGIGYTPDEHGNARLGCVALVMHISQTHSTSFEQLPDEVKQAAVQVFTIARKMKDGRIIRNESRIDTEDIAELASLLCNGEDLPEDGFEEIEDLSIAFPNLRL